MTLFTYLDTQYPITKLLELTPQPKESDIEYWLQMADKALKPECNAELQTFKSRQLELESYQTWEYLSLKCIRRAERLFQTTLAPNEMLLDYLNPNVTSFVEGSSIDAIVQNFLLKKHVINAALGIIYAHLGEMQKAREFFIEAETEGKSYLAQMYIMGLGVKPNPVYGEQLLKEGALLNCSNCKHLLAQLESGNFLRTPFSSTPERAISTSNSEDGSSTDIDTIILQLREKSDGDAFFILGQLYAHEFILTPEDFKKNGVQFPPKNLALAKNHFEAAYALEHPQAALALVIFCDEQQYIDECKENLSTWSGDDEYLKYYYLAFLELEYGNAKWTDKKIKKYRDSFLSPALQYFNSLENKSDIKAFIAGNEKKYKFFLDKLIEFIPQKMRDIQHQIKMMSDSSWKLGVLKGAYYGHEDNQRNPPYKAQLPDMSFLFHCYVWEYSVSNTNDCALWDHYLLAATIKTKAFMEREHDRPDSDLQTLYEKITKEYKAIVIRNFPDPLKVDALYELLWISRFLMDLAKQANNGDLVKHIQTNFPKYPQIDIPSGTWYPHIKPSYINSIMSEARSRTEMVQIESSGPPRPAPTAGKGTGNH